MPTRVLLVLLFNVFCSVTYVLTQDNIYYTCSKQAIDKGTSIQIVKFNDKQNEENKFELDLAGLESILLRPEMRNKQIVSLSIVGDYRKGKSFMLKLLLQYLESGGKGIDSDTIDLTHGFHSQGGSQRDTTGISMWSEPFCVKTPSGNELAIILMDTQGVFDNTQSVGDSATIFALAFLTSSIQIYNQKDVINEKDLQYLEVFTEYGKQIKTEENNEKPFQKLLFLIRDWQYPGEYPFGGYGGQKYLNERIMNSKSNEQEQAKELRQNLESLYNNISCFLMPYPNNAVASGKFTAKEIDLNFIKNVNEFGKMLFLPENLLAKQISGNNITGNQLVEYFKSYIEDFKKPNDLKPDSIKRSTEKANIAVSFGDAKTNYITELSKKCSDQLPSENPIELQKFYVNISNFTIKNFVNKIKKYSRNDLNKKYLTDLQKWMEDKFSECIAQNQIKRVNEVTKQLQSCNEERKKLSDSVKNVTEQLSNTKEQLTTCNIDKAICDTNKGNCDTQLTTCNQEKNTCNKDKDTCNTDKATCNADKNNCDKQLNTCNTEKNTCDTDKYKFLEQRNNAISIGACAKNDDCYMCRSHNRCCFKPINLLNENNPAIGICTCEDGRGIAGGVRGHCSD